MPHKNRTFKEFISSFIVFWKISPAVLFKKWLKFKKIFQYQSKYGSQKPHLFSQGENIILLKNLTCGIVLARMKNKLHHPVKFFRCQLDFKCCPGNKF